MLFLKFPLTCSFLLTLCDLCTLAQLRACLASIFYHTIHCIFPHYSPGVVKHELWQTAPLFLWLYFIYKSLQVCVVIWNFHTFYSLLCNLEDYLQSMDWQNNLYFRLEEGTSACAWAPWQSGKPSLRNSYPVSVHVCDPRACSGSCFRKIKLRLKTSR